MIPNDTRLNEQDSSEKLHGTHDDSDQKEKYIRDAGKIEDLPSQDELAKMDADPSNEGHTKEWEDRARVVLDAKKDAGSEADPNQSPETNEKENGASINENNTNY